MAAASKRFLAALVIVGMLVVIVSIAGILVGSVGVGVGTTLRILLHRIAGSAVISPDWTRSQDLIIADVRTPRVILAGIVGAGLALAGTTLQAVVRNPLADPGVLGVSAGAAIGAVTVLRFQLGSTYTLVPIAAFAGALFAMFAVLAITGDAGRLDSSRLVLAGVAVSAIFSALTSLMVLTSPDQAFAGQVLQWTLGGFGGASWSRLWLPVIVTTIGFLALLALVRPLNILLSGEESATALGVDVKKTRIVLIVVSSVLTGTLVSVSGIVGFIGLVIPHVARMLVGSNHLRTIPIAALIGAGFAVMADLAARTLMSPQELPVGIITALIGGPFFIWLLHSRSRRR